MKLVPIGSMGIRVDIDKLNSLSHNELVKLRHDIATMAIEPEIRSKKEDIIVDTVDFLTTISNVLTTKSTDSASSDSKIVHPNTGDKPISVNSQNSLDNMILYEPLIRELTDKIKSLQHQLTELEKATPSEDSHLKTETLSDSMMDSQTDSIIELTDDSTIYQNHDSIRHICNILSRQLSFEIKYGDISDVISVDNKDIAVEYVNNTISDLVSKLITLI